jgi:hypothetical protein
MVYTDGSFQALSVKKEQDSTVLQRNAEARSSNSCCRGKATYYVLHILCLYPYLSSMQGACAVLYCQLRPVCLYRISPLYLINGTILGKILYIDRKMCVLIFSKFFSETFIIIRRIQ